MVLGREDMEHDPGGEGGEVPDGLNSGDGSPSLWVFLRPGPQAYLRLLYGSGLPPQRTSERSRQVPRGAQAAPPLPTERPNEGGRNIRGPTEGRLEGTGKVREEERVNLGSNVETRRRESLRAPIFHK